MNNPPKARFALDDIAVITFVAKLKHEKYVGTRCVIRSPEFKNAEGQPTFVVVLFDGLEAAIGAHQLSWPQPARGNLDVKVNWHNCLWSPTV